MSFSVNKVILVGNITQDIDFRTIPSGTPVARINIATNRSYRDKTNQLRTEADYHRIVAWGKLAELCKQYLEKGRMIYVEGRLQTRSWQDQSGNKVSVTEVIADQIRFGPKGGGSAAGAGGFAPRPGAAAATQQGADAGSDEISGEGQTPQINIEDIPY